MEHTLSPRRRLYDHGLRLLLWVCAGITCALLIFLIGYIFTAAWAISPGSC